MKKYISLFCLVFIFENLFAIEFVEKYSFLFKFPYHEGYTPCALLWLKNSLIIENDVESLCIIDGKQIYFFDNNDDREYIEKYRIYGIWTETFYNITEDKYYFMDFSVDDISIFHCWEFSLENGNLIKREVSKEYVTKIKKSSQKREASFPCDLSDNSQVVFNSVYIDFPNSFERKKIFQIQKKDRILFDFEKDFPQKKIETQPFINDTKTEMAFFISDKNIAPLNGQKEYQLVIFSIIYDAKLNDSRVRLRVEPNLSCSTVTMLEKSQKVKVTDRSDDKFKIDGESWYWYKVETEEGQSGWVYGKYLDIE